MNKRDERGSRAKGGQLRTGGDRAVWRHLLAGLLLLAELSCGPLRAQTNGAKAAPLSRRWLFVVETSKSMQPRAESVLGAVRGMLGSDLSGQLQAGDTLGLWTFNEDLYAGRLPLQMWSPQAREEIMQRTVAFLRSQRYEKQARFDKVATALDRVIKDSELITVILISSGESKVQGTGIDGRINEYYTQWNKQQQKGRIPFIIVMRAQNGRLAEHAFNTALWPVQLPALDPEMRRLETAPEGVTGATPTNILAAVPPQAVSAKQAQPEPAQTPKAESAVGKVEAPSGLESAGTTNEPVKVRPPEPAAQPVEAIKTEPPPTVVAATATNELLKAKPPAIAPPVEVAKTGPPPTVGLATTTNEPAKAMQPEPAALPVEAAKLEPPPAAVVATTINEPVQAKRPEPAPPPIEVAKAEQPPTVRTATTTNEPVKVKPPEPAAPRVEAAKAEAPPAVAEIPANDPAPTPTPAPAPVTQLKQEIPTPSVAKPVEPMPAKPEAAVAPAFTTPMAEPVTVRQLKESPAPQVATGPAPSGSSTHENTRTAAASAAATQPAAAATWSPAPPPSVLPTPPVQNATAVPAGTLTTHLSIWIVGLASAIVVAICSMLLLRRPRATPQGSLITRSFEREKKP